MINKDSITWTIVFTFIITFIFTGILAIANEFTKNRIERNNELFYKRSILRANQIHFDSNRMIEELFDTKLSRKKIGNEIIYVYEKEIDDTVEQYYSIIFHGNGLWGPINGVLTVNESLDTIIGIDFIEQNETPGLGGRIEENDFLEQFQNKTILDNKIEFVSGLVHRTKADNKIDSISGATLTSNSVEKIINRYLIILNDIMFIDKE